MSLKSILALAVAGLILTGCSTVGNAEPNPDPLDAAQTAFNHDDWRLMALASTNPDIPGVTGDLTYLKNVERKFGLLYTAGTAPGDVKYAEDYNRKMLDLQGCDARDPMARCTRPPAKGH
jgi:hypothetical protein